MGEGVGGVGEGGGRGFVQTLDDASGQSLSNARHPRSGSP